MSQPILLISGDFVTTGGMDRANHALAAHLARSGRELHLTAYRAADDLLAYPNVHPHRVPKPLNSYTLGAPLLDRFGRSDARRMQARGGRVVVNGGNCPWGDVNWVHHLNVLDTPKPGGGPWRRFKTGLDYRLYVAAERKAVAKARVIVTTCEKNRTDLHAHFGKPLDRISTIYYGTDPTVFFPAEPDERRRLREKFGWPLDRKTYAFVGALGDRRKGFDTLFEAWKLLCARSDWDADLAVIGTGSELDHWRERASNEGLKERFRFLGFRRDVPDLFRACDAHVLPSRYEGYSLVTQEAICCGLPAFITKVAGIAERFPSPLDEALLIHDPDDSKALAEQIASWRDREAILAPDLARFADTLRAHTWDHMARQFTEILDRSPA